MSTPIPSCVVVVPLHTFQLPRNETRALLNAFSKLKNFEFILLHKASQSPAGFLKDLSIAASAQLRVSTRSVPDGDLASVAAYNQLLMRADFYEMFAAWDYILVFQLDAWIFNDSLCDWLVKGYTYVGAPWTGELGEDTPDTGVGNGGLSLRAVDGMIRILRSRAFHSSPVFRSSDLAFRLKLFTRYGDFPVRRRPLLFLKRLGAFFAMSCGWRNTLRHYVNCQVQEDHFFGIYAPHVYPWMLIPGLWEAACFSIETNPRATHARISPSTPLGCHAWEKHDKAFWLNTYPHEFSDIE
ncbi:DUF5672 family protein [Synechococcus sp. CCY 9618]|uniref:DUF5672 family protein n=1 Tax=Synechococcus sp. CCY 9618 TaxID=2815602 RepID=UPI001C2205CC|nr:DUF5672 family protein [Synechococcus sp. CCY 9618]